MSSFGCNADRQLANVLLKHLSTGIGLGAIFTLPDYADPPLLRMGALCTLVSHSFLPALPLITCPSGACTMFMRRACTHVAG